MTDQGILRAVVSRCLLESCEAMEMLDYKQSGFSAEAGVRFQAHDCGGLERLVRNCARPPFATDWLHKAVAGLSTAALSSTARPVVDNRGTKADELHVTPLEWIDRLAALVPSPRTHRHRCFGVLVPNRHEAQVAAEVMADERCHQTHG